MSKVLAFLLLMAAGLQAQQPGCSAGANGCGQVLYPQQNIQTIASAGTIAPSTFLVAITGTAAIATITPPAGFSVTVGGCIDILATGAWTTTTAGNIQAVMTASANTIYRACYVPISGTPKWVIK
jgi:hypothetical protein